MSSLMVEATGEVITAMDRAEAETITRKITSELDGITTHWNNVVPMIAEAMTRQAWAALGYGNAGAYVVDRFGASLAVLPTDVRQAVSGDLSTAGMSVRAIAEVTGVGKSTAARDIESSTVPSGTVAPTPEAIEDPEPQPWTSATAALDQLHEAAAQTDPGHTIGLNGKRYQRPAPKPAEPAKPKRRPLLDTANDAGWDIRKAVEKAQRITKDDRYPKNENEVATRMRGHLMFAVEACQDLLDQMPTSTEGN